MLPEVCLCVSLYVCVHGVYSQDVCVCVFLCKRVWPIPQVYVGLYLYLRTGRGVPGLCVHISVMCSLQCVCLCVHVWGACLQGCVPVFAVFSMYVCVYPYLVPCPLRIRAHESIVHVSPG